MVYFQKDKLVINGRKYDLDLQENYPLQDNDRRMDNPKRKDRISSQHSSYRLRPEVRDPNDSFSGTSLQEGHETPMPVQGGKLAVILGS
jgi:hypothetical protein